MGLEVFKSKVPDLGLSIYSEAVSMIKKTYIDDCSGGSLEDTVDRLMGDKVTDNDGKVSYNRTISQNFALGVFKLKVMVRDSETRPDIIAKLGGGVLCLFWEPARDVIIMYLRVNLSLKKANISLGSKLTADTMHQLDTTEMTRRLEVSQVNSIYGPLGLLTLITIRFKLILQRISSMELGWNDVLNDDIAKNLCRILAEMVETPRLSSRPTLCQVSRF